MGFDDIESSYKYHGVSSCEDLDDILDEYLEQPDSDPDALLMQNVYRNMEQMEVTLSEFTKLAIRMPAAGDSSVMEPFSFKERPHMLRLYDTPARRLLLVTARQVEKSTLLGNRIIAMSCLIPHFKSLYVSPTAQQTKTFSDDRLKEPLETSEMLRPFLSRARMVNVFEKQFANWSKISLRNSYLNADRVRGVSVWQLLIDEFQDILMDNVPVIEQTTSHAPEQWKSYVYAGTPKTFDNAIEQYKTGVDKTGLPMSTQSEWVVPCDSCGTDSTYRHWNILGEANISRKGLVCDRCGALIHAQHPDAQWAAKFANARAESYRISQLMVPWKSWDEILLDQSRYSRAKFFNEVLGLSYDSGERPFNMDDIQGACTPGLKFLDEALLERFTRWDLPIFAGLDHGTGENTYSVITLGTYIDNVFTVFYAHRFDGIELEFEVQMKEVERLLRKFRVAVIGSDYGGGFHQNDRITRLMGPARVMKCQYAGRRNKKVEFNRELRRYILFRAEVMSDVMHAIKRRKIRLPDFEEFSSPYGQDFCNITAEYNETQRIMQYGHGLNRPDDTFHSVLYCFLASIMWKKRPDILKPLQEDEQGNMHTGYSGPQDQDFGYDGYRPLLQHGQDDVVDVVVAMIRYEPTRLGWGGD